MSRDKQIEEMAWLKCCCHSNKGICGMDGKPCDLDCGSYHEAEALYNAGYRKSTDLAEEIFAEIERFLVEKLSSINAFRIKGDSFYDGEIHALELLLYKNAELKKKYTEGDNDVK